MNFRTHPAAHLMGLGRATIANVKAMTRPRQKAAPPAVTAPTAARVVLPRAMPSGIGAPIGPRRTATDLHTAAAAAERHRCKEIVLAALDAGALQTGLRLAFETDLTVAQAKAALLALEEDRRERRRAVNSAPQSPAAKTAQTAAEIAAEVFATASMFEPNHSEGKQ